MPDGKLGSARRRISIFNWKRKCGGLSPTEMRRLKRLENENANLKKVVADLCFRASSAEDFEACPEAQAG
jgi:putative transposase